MRVTATRLALQGLLSPVHVRSGLGMADAALQLVVLIVATLVAEREVVAEGEIRVADVDPLQNIFLAIVLLGPTVLALEAVLTLPMVWDAFDFRLEAESMVRPVTQATEHQLVFFCSLPTCFARLAVEALPV